MKGQTLLLCAQLLNGIHFLHVQLDVAHMDIKPNNLLLDIGSDASSTLKIIDFNISIMDAHKRMVLPGARGTKGYMAPEVQGPSPYAPLLADRYSCGICMIELLNIDEDQENVDSCFENFISFATKLCSQSPEKRPSLTEVRTRRGLTLQQPLETLLKGQSSDVEGCRTADEFIDLHLSGPLLI